MGDIQSKYHGLTDHQINLLVVKYVLKKTMRDWCDTFRVGKCNGEHRTRCGACGAAGHGNCYGNGSGPIQVGCSDGCGAASYSTDPAAAWSLIEETIKGETWFWQLKTMTGKDGTVATLVVDEGMGERRVSWDHKSMPRAVCYAALEAADAPVRPEFS